MKLREQVLKVAATFTVKARQIRVRLGVAANKWWPRLLDDYSHFPADMTWVASAA
ncbi:hypothetical protein HZS81_17460 [Halomonas salicampi]|uniref:Uncharacterized protein n=1 Tax=Vreelandella salicampi TaxID=1449798 RepID=A0A7Z0RWD8_9GAMM|nr:hypothetical protein [Halomonas salicampi]